MTDEQFRQAYEGLKMAPERHFVIDGRQAVSLEQLVINAGLSGYTPPAEFVIAPISVQTSTREEGLEVLNNPLMPIGSAQREQVLHTPSGEAPKAETKAPPKPSAKAKAKKPASKSKVAAPAAAKPAPPVATAKEGEIPDNLGTLSYNALRSLASSLGITPVPNTQSDLMAAIEARRPKA